jgi:hypothetical protein
MNWSSLRNNRLENYSSFLRNLSKYRPRFDKESSQRMSTSSRSDLERQGSQPIMSKNLPGHCNICLQSHGLKEHTSICWPSRWKPLNCHTSIESWPPLTWEFFVRSFFFPWRMRIVAWSNYGGSWSSRRGTWMSLYSGVESALYLSQKSWLCISILMPTRELHCTKHGWVFVSAQKGYYYFELCCTTSYTYATQILTLSYVHVWRTFRKYTNTCTFYDSVTRLYRIGVWYWMRHMMNSILISLSHPLWLM